MSGNVTTARPGKAATIALWVVTGLLAFMFILAGVMKFADPDMAAHFRTWGYPDWFRDLIGLVEIGAAVALLFPRTAFYGSAALAIVMVGAIFTHVTHNEMPEAVAPLVLLVLLVLVGYARRPRSGVFVENRG